MARVSQFFLCGLHGRQSTMGLAFDVVLVRDYHFYQGLFKDTIFVDGTPLIDACRQIKSFHEIQQMEAAAKVSKKIFDFMEENLTPGFSEMEFCGDIEAFARCHGHSGKLQMAIIDQKDFFFIL